MDIILLAVNVSFDSDDCFVYKKAFG